MAHIRANCKNLSTSISLDEEIFKLIDDYRFENRKENRSVAIADLVKKGLRYEQLRKKKHERVLV